MLIGGAEVLQHKRPAAAAAASLSSLQGSHGDVNMSYIQCLDVWISFHDLLPLLGDSLV